MKSRFTALTFLSFAVLLFAFRIHKSASHAEQITAAYQVNCTAFEKSVDSLRIFSAYNKSYDGTSLARLKKAFRACKRHYKQIEMFTEYSFPSTAKSLNGPLVIEADEDEGTQNIFYPEGLQVLEDMIYNGNVNDEITELNREIQRTHNYARRLNFMAASLKMEDWQIFDAAKLQVVRIFILSMAGYDAPYTGDVAGDNGIALRYVEETLCVYGGGKHLTEIQRLVARCDAQLSHYREYEKIDRLHLIMKYMNPLFEHIELLKRELNITAPELVQPLRQNALSYWQTASYNLNAYSRYDKPYPANDKAVALGKLLFFDPLLSKNGERSCASCHRPDKAFTDGRATSLSFEYNGNLKRNAPTLLNVGFQSAYFYDARALYLEDQIRMVVANPFEMHGNLAEAAHVINQSAEYKNMFREAYAGTGDTVVSAVSIIRAISAFERSLFSFGSRFDRHVRGEKKTLTKEEIAGFNLFMGKALCGTCHFAPTFGGVLPPAFDKTELEIIGTPGGTETATAKLDTDLGKGGVNNLTQNLNAFKTPTVRNVSYTGPYMHNGVFATLEEVVEFYDKGGGAGMGFGVPNQTLPFDSLQLTKPEIRSIVAFMHALADTTNIGITPKKLPRIDNRPQYDSRKVGGSY